MASVISVREDIMEYLVAVFQGVAPGVVVGEQTYSTAFDAVSRFPFRGQDQLMNCEISIIDLKEKKKQVMLYQDCFLMVTTEFRYRLQLGDDPLTEANRVLSDIQLAMRSDITCDAKSLNVTELSNELDPEHGGIHIVGGIAFWEIRYRHRWDDPRRMVGQ